MYLIYKVRPTNTAKFEAALPRLTQFWKAIPGVISYRNLKPNSFTIQSHSQLVMIEDCEYVSLVEFDTESSLQESLKSSQVLETLKQLRQMASINPLFHVCKTNVEWSLQ